MILALLRFPFALALLVYQSIFLALGQIRTNKVRSLLTTLGLMIGVASVTAVIAALSGLKAKVLADFESIGTNRMFIMPDFAGPRTQKVNWRMFRFTPQQFEGLLEHCPSVAALTRVVGLGGRTISNGPCVEDSAQIMGIEPDWHKIENRSVTLGRPFTLVDTEQARPVCLINDKLRDKLHLARDCAGETIMIGQRRFTVVGIVEPRAELSVVGEGQTGSEAYVPFTTAYNSQPYSHIMVMATCRSPEVADDAKAEVQFFLRQRRHVRLGEPDSFRIELVQKFLKQFQQIATTMTLVAAGIVGISLLVGGIGIMNIMLVSVSERTREIGLRKAVGARPFAILLQFLVEAVILCCFGGALGLAGGRLLVSVIVSIPNINMERAYIPGWAVALAFGFSSAVGIVFGFFPALKAARLDPIEALRHE